MHECTSVCVVRTCVSEGGGTFGAACKSEVSACDRFFVVAAITLVRYLSITTNSPHSSPAEHTSRFRHRRSASDPNRERQGFNVPAM